MADNYLEKQRADFEARQAALARKKSERRKKLMDEYRKKLAEHQKNQ